MNKIENVSLYRPELLLFTLNGKKYISDGVIIVLEKNWTRYRGTIYPYIIKEKTLRVKILKAIKGCKECNKDKLPARVSNFNNIDSVDQNING